MVDLETLSSHSNAVITSIAVVQFDIFTGEIIREYYQTIDIQSCMELELEIDSKTLSWWLKQPNETRTHMNDEKSVSIQTALKHLSRWMKENIPDVSIDTVSSSSSTNPNKDTIKLGNTYVNQYMWGNGSSFDLGILADAYRKCGIKNIPWKYWNERDVRTMLALYPEAKNLTKFKGTPHNPVDDCKFQIEYLSKIIQKIYNLNV